MDISGHMDGCKHRRNNRKKGNMPPRGCRGKYQTWYSGPRGGGEYHGGVNGIPVNLNVNITNEIDTIIVTLPIVCSKPMCIENKSTSISFIITPPHTTVSPPPNTALK